MHQNNLEFPLFLCSQILGLPNIELKELFYSLPKGLTLSKIVLSHPCPPILVPSFCHVAMSLIFPFKISIELFPLLYYMYLSDYLCTMRSSILSLFFCRY